MLFAKIRCDYRDNHYSPKNYISAIVAIIGVLRLTQELWCLTAFEAPWLTVETKRLTLELWWRLTLELCTLTLQPWRLT
jgi:hypothetical protein